MIKRTFFVTSCKACANEPFCGAKNKGIDRDDIYQSLHDAKLYTFLLCPEDLHETMFVEVKEEK